MPETVSAGETTRDETIRFFIDMSPVSEPNHRNHYVPRLQRVRKHRKAGLYLTRKHLFGLKPVLPLKVKLTRVGKRMDDDNNIASMKAMRDGIAEALGFDDAQIDWQYEQAAPRREGVYVEII